MPSQGSLPRARPLLSGRGGKGTPPAVADWLVARPIAHRGLHDAAKGILENTISAAEAAIAGG
ncbi:MAG TPA: hypothetical protein VHG30_19080, partial [Microvirga sp.]|nr:hypothetical protein [Microvirga sp.]